MENRQSVFFLPPHTCEARALRARKTLTPRFTDFFTDFEKETDCFAVYMFENLSKRVSHTVCLIWKFSRGGSRQHFYQATQNGARTAIVFACQSKHAHFKEF